MSRKVENKRIKDISEGNFHSIHASNQAEKFKFSKLCQGIESCRQAQSLKYRKEEMKLMKTLAQFDREKSKYFSEDEQFFWTYSPGDGITMLSYSDLQDEEKEGSSAKDGFQDEEEGDEILISGNEPYEIPLSDEKGKELLELDLLGKEQDNKAEHLNEEIRRYSPGRDALEHGRDNGVNKHYCNSGNILSTAGSNKTIGRRRFSLDDKDDVIPFYMKRKYDHHMSSARLSEQRHRLLCRRNLLTLEDERYLFEKQLMAPSADLGTISFKSAGVDRSWLNTDIRREREEAIKRMPESGMEMNRKHRPSSGYRRVSIALERMPSEKSLLQSSLSINKAAPVKLQGTDSVESTGRRQSVPGRTSVSSLKSGLEEKIPKLNNRRHTIGEVIAPSLSAKRANLGSLKSFKSLREISCPADALSFEDKGIVFPAYENGKSYSLKEFISLRKCRYLRLSKLNWESLLWQSKHQALLNY